MATTPQELLAAADPAQALVALQAQVREKPGDAKLRIFLFQQIGRASCRERV